MRLTPEEALPLAHALIEAKETIGFCERCFNLTAETLCEICRDMRRDPSLVVVVEEPADVPVLERAHQIRGLYHVLGGALSPIDGIGPDRLRISELFQRIKDEDIRELVVATNPTMTGEATALYIAEQLQPLVAAGKLRVTRPAAGLPMGSDLEYADEVTLGRALAARTDVLGGYSAPPRSSETRHAGLQNDGQD